MSLFGAIPISASGLDAAQTWINTTAGNLANADDVASTANGAYATQTPVFQAMQPVGQIGSGVAVSGVALGDTVGHIEYEPTNPLADKNGEVRVPDVDTATQLTGLIQAQDDYQANANALQHATTAYQAALALGK
jgi:flagellar basal-body rod protein FlgC